MPKEKTGYLVQLINTLTASEKRNFKLSAHKSGVEDKIYVQLFDYLAKAKTYNEDAILKKIPAIKKQQLSNLKANLYKQILRSLREINRESYAEIKAREKFDFAKLLYSKGQYKASLEMLNEVKKISSRIEKKPLLYLALSFEKQIESQHVTLSMSKRASELADHSTTIINNLITTNKLSNLSLALYGIHLQRGYVKNAEDIDYLKAFFAENLPSVNESDLDFFQKLYLYQSYVWYYQMLQDFALYYRYAQKWIDLFEAYPQMKKPETTLYIKGIHNVLNALFISGKYKKFEELLHRLLNFQHENGLTLSLNEQSQLTLFSYTHGINLIFLTKNYLEGITVVQGLQKLLRDDTYPWDLNRKLVFYYKIACVYFGANQLDRCIHYLNKITNYHFPNFKEDIQCFARILNLIAHFDLGNDTLVSYQVRSVYRYLLKMKEMQQAQLEIFKFVRRTPQIKKADVISEFEDLKAKLLPLEKDKIERRPFLYLDIISWLDSKIYKTSMVEAIKARSQSNK